MEDEQWLPLNGADAYKDSYAVSNLGRMKRVDSGRILKAWTNKLGYKTVRISANSEMKTFMVHILVACAFHGLRPEGLVCAHLDGNPGNCRKDNLKWVTYGENHMHKHLHGTMPCGEKHYRCAITEEIIRKWPKMRATGMSWREIAEEFGITRSCIKAVATGTSWKHLTGIRKELAAATIEAKKACGNRR